MLQSSKSARSPVLVGRAMTLQTLEDIANQTRSRRGQVAVVAGQAGISKSRLVKELLARLVGADFLALQHVDQPTRSDYFGAGAEEVTNILSQLSEY